VIHPLVKLQDAVSSPLALTITSKCFTKNCIVAMESVSRKLRSDEDWEKEIELFWKAMDRTFMVQKNTTCGSHIHVAPIGRPYTLREVKSIAFACCFYEPYVVSLLPTERRDHPYCKRNSKVTTRMGMLYRQRTSVALKIIANDIREKTSRGDVCKYIQNGLNHSDRGVLWNFQNLVNSTTESHSPSGTIEFRGGRHLRGPVRTLRWITLAIVFISMAIHEVRFFAVLNCT
jgi:hypothetical protein